MNTTQTGDISEYKFILYCLEHDVSVSKPIGNGLPYDFIIDYNNKLLKIQVKTAYKSNAKNCWAFNTRSTSKNYNEVTNHSYVGLIDYFAVVNPEHDDIIFVQVNSAATGSMVIFYGEQKICKTQNHYIDYILF